MNGETPEWYQSINDSQKIYAPFLKSGALYIIFRK